MIKGATVYLRDIIPDDNYVGIVPFQSTASVSSYLERINDQSRETLVNRLPPVSSESTCIGCGIITAIEASAKESSFFFPSFKQIYL